MTKQFINHPNFDINYYSEDEKCSILGKAIQEENANAIEILLENEKININKKSFKSFTPLIMTVGQYTDIKILKMLCNNPQIDVNSNDENWNVNAMQICVSRGNFLALKYLTENCDKLNVDSFGILFFYSLKEHSLKTCKDLLIYYLKTKNDKNYDQIV